MFHLSVLLLYWSLNLFRKCSSLSRLRVRLYSLTFWELGLGVCGTLVKCTMNRRNMSQSFTFRAKLRGRYRHRPYAHAPTHTQLLPLPTPPTDPFCFAYSSSHPAAETTDLSAVSTVLPSPESHRIKNIQHKVFSDRFHSLLIFT